MVPKLDIYVDTSNPSYTLWCTDQQQPSCIRLSNSLWHASLAQVTTPSLRLGCEMVACLLSHLKDGVLDYCIVPKQK
jgi:hypothetical protein